MSDEQEEVEENEENEDEEEEDAEENVEPWYKPDLGCKCDDADPAWQLTHRSYLELYYICANCVAKC